MPNSNPAPALLAATAFMVGTIGLCIPGDAGAGLNPLNSRKHAAKHVIRIAAKTAKVRQLCGNDIEKELIPWTVDCSADPVSFSGTGTGNLEIDVALDETLSKGSKPYLRLRLKGIPSEHGLSNVCGAATEDWSEIDDCLFNAANDTSKALLGLTFYDVERAVGDGERKCRLKLGRITRSFFAKSLRNRAKCFSKNGLLGAGAFADRYECLAPAIPPGLGRSTTGLKKVDNSIQKSFNLVRTGIDGACPDNLEANGFPGGLTDPTGGIFGQPDLVQIVLHTVVQNAHTVLTGVYAGEEYCGDGIVQAHIGEQCDDGDRDSCELDSTCDYNCQIQACGNGVACEDTLFPLLSEECDDGDDRSEDGCTPGCVYEYCGDGILQEGLGEECDDGNQIDGDGCTDRCKTGF